MRSCTLCTVFLLFFVIFGNSVSAEDIHPLAPPDTSSPRATLKTFLDNGNMAVEAYKSGQREKAKALFERAVRCLNLEEEPPALREALGIYAALYLKETLDRIEVPAFETIPDVQAVKIEKLTTWTVPYTEITIGVVKDASMVERFLFTTDTVRNAENYYRAVKQLPYRLGSGGGAFLDKLRDSGSWIVPKHLMDGFPQWTRMEIYGQAAWQWIGLFFYFIIGIGAVVLVHKWSDTLLAILDRKFGWTLEHTVGGLSLPVSLIFFAAIGLWLIVYGLHFLDAEVYVPIAFVFLFVSYLGWIWLIGALFNRLSNAVVSLGGFVREGMDAQLIRLGFQIVTVIIVGVTAIYLGARLGLPTYSLVTGLGIGGLAVALAGREALSNIIGTIMIILDRTFKLGDYIVLDSGERGQVTEVGIRSTRIRTRDDILISIPNAVIANVKMINESAPVSTHRIRVPVGVAYGSDLKEVERILLEIAEQNKLVVPDPPPRVRLRRFGDSALELELLCWIDPPEFKGEATHHLNWAIYAEFQSKGVEIPFPQRDVHIVRTDSASRGQNEDEPA